MRQIVIIAITACLVVVAAPRPAIAQSGPVCDIGCPCGNTCISCADTCRVGGGSASSAGGGAGYDPLFIALVLGGAFALLVGTSLAFYVWATMQAEKARDEDPRYRRSRGVLCKEGDVGCFVPLLSSP